MSFLNALVNQVGREVGRDLYRGAKTSIKASNVNTNRSVMSNVLISHYIDTFQVSPYDKVTFRNINTLYEKMQSVNPRSFDWEECHLAFDKLIDSLKISLKAEFTESLEALDKQNSADYLVNKARHTTFIDKLILDYEEIIKSYQNRNGLITLALTFIGLNAVYTCKKDKAWSIFGVAWLLLGCIGIYNDKNKDTPIKMYLAVLLVCLTPTLIASIYRSINHNSTNKKNLATLETLRKYKEALIN